MFHVELKTFVCNIITDYYNCIDYISFISYNILDLIILFRFIIIKYIIGIMYY